MESVVAAKWALGKRLEQEQLVGKVLLPKGTRIISLCKLTNEWKSGLDKLRVQLGIPWSPTEFPVEAMRIGHPYKSFPQLRPSLKRSLLALLRSGPHMTKRHREKTLAYWKKRAEALAPAEKELHSKMEPQVEDVLKGKRILLLKEMLMSIAYSDVKVVEELVAGFPLVGELILSSLFPEQRKEATATREWAHSNARVFREEAV